jgi:hypothetical protein
MSSPFPGRDTGGWLAVTLSVTIKRLVKPFAAPIVEQILFQSLLYSRSRLGIRQFRRQQQTQLTRWQAVGSPDPPPDVIKHSIIRSYGKRFGLRTLVETGTFVGDTPEALQHDFDRIVTIELSGRLYSYARRRFMQLPQITVIRGDSGVVLHDIAPTLREPVLFWLDSHWSYGVTAKGDDVSPILREVATILDRNVAGDVLLVDDARLFGIDGYPDIDELRQVVLSRRKEWKFYVENDIVRAHAAVETA